MLVRQTIDYELSKFPLTYKGIYECSYQVIIETTYLLREAYQ